MKKFKSGWDGWWVHELGSSVVVFWSLTSRFEVWEENIFCISFAYYNWKKYG